MCNHWLRNGAPAPAQGFRVGLHQADPDRHSQDPPNQYTRPPGGPMSGPVAGPGGDVAGPALGGDGVAIGVMSAPAGMRVMLRCGPLAWTADRVQSGLPVLLFAGRISTSSGKTRSSASEVPWVQGCPRVEPRGVTRHRAAPPGGPTDPGVNLIFVAPSPNDMPWVWRKPVTGLVQGSVLLERATHGALGWRARLLRRRPEPMPGRRRPSPSYMAGNSTGLRRADKSP